MGKIRVVGLGFTKKQLTLGALEALQSGARVILHTGRCGAAEYLNRAGISYETLDSLYETAEDFDEHAQAAAEAVRKAALVTDVVYGVMDARDLSAYLLAREGAEVLPGPAEEGALTALTQGPVQTYSASDWEQMRPDAAYASIVREIDSREMACEVKLKLMETYPDDAPAALMTGDGTIVKIPLFQADRQTGYDHRCCLLVLPEPDAGRRNALRLEDLSEAARQSDAYYQEAEFDRAAEDLARAAGALAYGLDRGLWQTGELTLRAVEILHGEAVEI